MAVWRVTVSGSLYTDEQWANVFHVDKGGGASDSDIMDAFEALYSTNHTGGGLSLLFPCTGNAFGGVIGVQMRRITMQAVVSPGVPIERLVSHNGGQSTPGGLPVEVSLVISWRTALAGRSFRGRTYMPPWHENKNDDTGGTFPSPDSATITGQLVNIEGFLGDLVAADAPLVVYSRKLGEAHTVTGGFIDHAWDTQRRRGAGQTTSRSTFTTP
jgi:hypothetical protein